MDNPYANRVGSLISLYRSNPHLFNDNQLDELQELADQSGVGAIQRSIEQQGITADKLQFDEERMDPYKQVQFLQSLLQGLPIGTKEITYTQPTGIESFRQGAGNIMDILQQFGALRQAIPTG